MMTGQPSKSPGLLACLKVRAASAGASQQSAHADRLPRDERCGRHGARRAAARAQGRAAQAAKRALAAELPTTRAGRQSGFVDDAPQAADGLKAPGADRSRTCLL